MKRAHNPIERYSESKSKLTRSISTIFCRSQVTENDMENERKSNEMHDILWINIFRARSLVIFIEIIYWIFKFLKLLIGKIYLNHIDSKLASIGIELTKIGTKLQRRNWNIFIWRISCGILQKIVEIESFNTNDTLTATHRAMNTCFCVSFDSEFTWR